MKSKLTRREFIRRTGLGLAAGAAAAGAAAAAAATASVRAGEPARALAASPKPSTLPYSTFLPLVQSEVSQVVRVHAADATNWDFGSTWYGDPAYVNQSRVNSMVTRGVQEVACRQTTGEAWAKLMPGYATGKKIAINVNLNCSRFLDETSLLIDALPQVVIALVKSLIDDYAVAATDIILYDAKRPMLNRFYNPIHTQFPQLNCYDIDGAAPNNAPFDHIHDSLRIAFAQPNLKGERWLTDLLYQATYVINMPIMKKHGLQPTTLGFKNHFGSTSVLTNLNEDSKDNLHPYLNPANVLYNPLTIPFVDINANPNIRNKTVLTLADGLFGAPNVEVKPVPWTNTFGSNKAPNSLLFSIDPVAIDCVMADLLRAEFGFQNDAFPPVFTSEDIAYDYLKDAANRNMGMFEKGEPWGAGYNKITYKVVELQVPDTQGLTHP